MSTSSNTTSLNIWETASLLHWVLLSRIMCNQACSREQVRITTAAMSGITACFSIQRQWKLHIPKHAGHSSTQTTMVHNLWAHGFHVVSGFHITTIKLRWDSVIITKTCIMMQMMLNQAAVQDQKLLQAAVLARSREDLPELKLLLNSHNGLPHKIGAQAAMIQKLPSSTELPHAQFQCTAWCRHSTVWVQLLFFFPTYEVKSWPTSWWICVVHRCSSFQVSPALLL